MTSALCSYLSVHFLRFTERRVGADVAPFAGAAGTPFWLAMVDCPLGENVLAERIGRDWAVVGLHESGEVADEAATAPSALSPAVDEATESWHGSFDVVGHRGAVDWLDPGNPGLVLSPLDDDRGGCLAIMTTAGFIIDENFELARAQDFAANAARVAPILASAPGNVLARILNTAELAGVDGITFSVWHNDDAMRAAAYRPGAHREQLDRYKVEHTADRTSFTRLRPRATSGTWEGVDPIKVAEAAV